MQTAAILRSRRAGSKGDAIEDLEKAKWYLEREIRRRKAKDNGELGEG